MGKKKSPKVPSITGEGFKGKRDLNLDDLKKIAVESFNKDAIKKLVPDWSGEVAGIVGLTLSNDNSRSIDGRFVLLGSLCSEKRISAGKFWSQMDVPGTSGVQPETLSLCYSIPDCEIFKFPNGGLVSEYVDGDAVPHSFVRGDTQVQEDDLPDSYLGFAIRAFIVPTRETYAKLSVLLYPLTKDMLASNHPLSDNPGFPGITLFSGEFPLLPRSLERPLMKNWGCPITPAIIPGADLDGSANMPRTPLIRAAVAQIMRKAVRPDAKLNYAHLIPRWNEIFEHGISKLKEYQLDALWPVPAVRNEEFSEGRNHSSLSPPPS